MTQSRPRGAPAAKRPRRPRTPDPATDYARKVVRGKIVAGPWVRAACQRHLDDLKSAKARGLRWDPKAALAVYAFIARLTLGDGASAGQPFYLEPWQTFVVGSLFGWKRADGLRRFRIAYIEIGKGNGKSPLAAAIGLYMFLADGERSAEVYTAAVTRDQAVIPFRDAKRFAEDNPALKRRLIIHDRNLADPQTGSFFRPLSAEGRSLDGKRPSCAVIDEIHEHPNAMVVDKLQMGTKGREQPLMIGITNSGVDRGSVCYDHHEYSRKVVTGQVENDEWFGYVCALDDGDDWLNDRSCWVKANPNLGVSIQEEYLERQVREAKGMPAKQNIVARLNFCVWTDAVNAWISGEAWRAVLVPPAEAPLRGRPCYGALDLSSRRDLTSLAVFVPDDAGGGDLFARFWTPGETLRERELADRAPYAQWVREGHMYAPSCRSVDYRYVVQELQALVGVFDLRALAYDRWRIEDFRRALEEEGFDLPLLPFGQGFKDMAPAVDAFEGLILNGEIRIHTNPVLTWNAASAVLEQDPAGNRKFTKRKATGRIDGIVAATMAVGLALAEPEATDPLAVFAHRGLMEIDL